MLKAEVLLSPDLSSLVDFKGKTVVIIDVFRATTTICHAFNKHIPSVLTVSNASQALGLKNKHTLNAGERNGVKLEGFDLGNSPSEINALTSLPESLILTSTNGTKCIEIAVQNGALNVCIGSLNNVTALASFLIQSNQPFILFCAGWKGNPNIEDTYMAGALLDKLNIDTHNNDAATLAIHAYQYNKSNANYLKNSQHYKRLLAMGNNLDLALCCAVDTIPLVPVLVSFKNGIASFSCAK